MLRSPLLAWLGWSDGECRDAVAIVRAAEVSPSAAVLGPLCLDWVDSRLVVEAGLSTDSSGHRQTGLSSAEHSASFQQSTEVLAVGEHRTGRGRRGGHGFSSDHESSDPLNTRNPPVPAHDQRWPPSRGGTSG